MAEQLNLDCGSLASAYNEYEIGYHLIPRNPNICLLLCQPNLQEKEPEENI